MANCPKCGSKECYPTRFAEFFCLNCKWESTGGKLMTLGEYRVGIDFNPSANTKVNEIKRIAADFIDLLAGQRAETTQPSGYYDGGEIDRLWSLAMTHIETAAMYAVKAATKKPL